MGQIERILQLVQQDKINREDAAKLLAALSSGLATLPNSTWERLFAMLDQGMSVEALAQVLGAELEQDKDNRRSTWSTKGPRAGNFGMGRKFRPLLTTRLPMRSAKVLAIQDVKPPGFCASWSKPATAQMSTSTFRWGLPTWF
jgi:hypothetical protein